MDVHRFLAQSYMERHPERVTQCLLEMPLDVSCEVIADSYVAFSASLLPSLPLSFTRQCLQKIPTDRAAKILAEMDLKDQIYILRSLPDALLKSLRRKLHKASLRKIDELLRHKENTLLAILDPNVVVFEQRLLVGEAKKLYETQFRGGHTSAYLVDAKQRLCGVIGISQFLAAEDSAPVVSLSSQSVQYIPVDLKKESVLNHPAWERHHRLPVVDEQRRLLGVLKSKTLRKYIQREQTDRGLSLRTGAALGELFSLSVTNVFDGFLYGLSRAGSKDKNQK